MSGNKRRDFYRTPFLYQAMAICRQCDWRGRIHRTPVRRPAREAAIEERHLHGRTKGHPVAVVEQWNARCGYCMTQSDPLRDRGVAGRWLRDHMEQNPLCQQKRETQERYNEFWDEKLRAIFEG